MGFIFMAVVIFCCFLVSHKTTEARPWLTTRSNFNKITEIDSQVADIFQRVASTSPAPELLPIPDDIINLMQVSLHQVVEIHELAKYVNNQLINSNNPATKVNGLNMAVFVLREMQLQTAGLSSSEKIIIKQLNKIKDQMFLPDVVSGQQLLKPVNSIIDLRTQLMFEAFENGNEVLTSFWLECGVRMTATNKNKTALQLAVERNWPNVIKKLVEQGAVASLDASGESLLHQAARQGASSEVIQFLIDELKIDVNAEDDLGFRPLHSAVSRFTNEVVSNLVFNGADMESRTKAGMTPLHVAVIENKIRNVELLLHWGANLEAVDNYGRKPIDYARSHEEIERLLNNYLVFRKYHAALPSSKLSQS